MTAKFFFEIKHLHFNISIRQLFHFFPLFWQTLIEKCLSFQFFVRFGGMIDIKIEACFTDAVVSLNNTLYL